MSDAFIGQIMCTGFGFAPRNWYGCDGSTLAIAQNQALFSLLGTQYGGDGIANFKLPDLRGRVPVGGFNPASGQQPFPVVMGGVGGAETVTLDVTQNPTHIHSLNAVTAAGNAPLPTGAALAATDPAKFYAPAAAGQAVALGGGPTSSIGGAAHPNLQPYQVINMCMCLYGIFPSRP